MMYGDEVIQIDAFKVSHLHLNIALVEVVESHQRRYIDLCFLCCNEEKGVWFG